MNKFFNMIPGTDSCCILLYGEIGEYGEIRSADIAKELYEAATQYKKIDIRINSLGGDVYAGIAIFNAVRNSDTDITIYVDGIAASMASVIALCGKPVYMSKYSRLMIHGVTGGCYGSKEELLGCVKDIEALEATLCAMYAAKTKKGEVEIRTTYFDGQDHWLTATEALVLGFIDGIYDAEPIPEDSTPEQVYNIYQNRLKTNPIEPKQSTMIEKLKQRPGFAACATEEDVLRHVEELERKATNAETLETENTALKAAATVAEEAEIDRMVETAYTEQRITEPERASFKAVLKADRANGEALLKSRQPKRRILNDLGNPGSGSDESPWDKRMKELEARNK